MSYVYRIIALFCLGWAIIYADRTALYPMLPVLGAELNLTAAQAGAIASAYFAAYAVAMPLSGFLGDRFGLKRVLVAMVLLAGLGLTGLALLANNYELIIFFIALAGAGVGVFYPAAYSIALYSAPAERRGFSAAVINSGMSVGLGLGLAAAGPLYLLTGTWRAPYLAMAVLTVGVALLFQLGVRPIPPRPQSARATWKLILNPTLLAMDVAAFCSLYGFWVAVTWGPTFFQSERGLSLSASGLYTALIAVAALPAGLLTGRISDRWGRRRVALVLLPLAAGSLLLLAGVQSMPALVAGLIAYGLTGKLALDPVASAWAADIIALKEPQAMGSAMGVLQLRRHALGHPGARHQRLDQGRHGSLVVAFYLAAVLVLAGAAAMVAAREPGQA